MKSWAVIQFPGSNCDHDAYRVLQALSQEFQSFKAVMHWHDDPVEPGQYEVIILPGGFSYGDYLRAGAIARLSRALEHFSDCVEAGAHVLGICNGFQILLEMRLLPGYLQVNESMRFISKTSALTVCGEAFPWLTQSDRTSSFHFPIAHRFGNYHASEIDRSEVHPVLVYDENPNGSWESTAGIYRRLGKGSLLGLMPHPERAFFSVTRNSEGRRFFTNAVEGLRSL